MKKTAPGTQLTFANGAALPDPAGLFYASLERAAGAANTAPKPKRTNT